MAKQARTLPHVLWGLISAAMASQDIQRNEMAKMIGVHANTVSSDAREPEKIPLDRFSLYLTALGIDQLTVTRPIAASITECMIK